MWKRPVLIAASATIVLWLCQALTVHYNYGGNWTGLFCISPHMPVPPFLASERLYLFSNTHGYDGQLFHLIAHDPWITKGSADAIGGAAFRYQRIFVPALAWMLALGRDQYVHAAYFAVILASAFAGTFWLASLAKLRGLHPLWGLAFIAVPATITSLDRMTADITLAAFCAGFVLRVETRSHWRVLVMLTCAALTRETAALIIGGYCLFLLTRRQLAQAIAVACTLLPAGAWFLYVTANLGTSRALEYLNWIPFYGFVDRVIRPQVYPLAPSKAAISIGFDFVALLGMGLLFAAVARMAMKRRWNAEAAAVYVLALAAVFVRNRDVWEDAYNFGRVFSPLLFLAFVEQFSAAPFLALVPTLLVDSRIALNLAGQVKGIIHGLLK